MAVRVQFTDQISAADGIKVLVYGQSGVGKTSLAVNAPSPLIFSAENGLLSVRRVRIPYIDISNYKNLLEAFRWFMTSQESRQVGTLILDSASEIAEVVLAEELKNSKDPRQAYGKMQQSMYEMMRAFRDVKGKNVVLIAKEIGLDVGVAKKASPIMPSASLLAQVPYFWDLVLHMHIGMNTANGETYRAFHTQDNPLWVAKDRSGNLDPLEQTNLTYIFNKASA